MGFGFGGDWENETIFHMLSKGQILMLIDKKEKGTDLKAHAITVFTAIKNVRANTCPYIFDLITITKMVSNFLR